MDFLLLPTNTVVPNSASTPLTRINVCVFDPVDGNSSTTAGDVVVVDLGAVVVVIAVGAVKAEHRTELMCTIYSGAQ